MNKPLIVAASALMMIGLAGCAGLDSKGNKHTAPIVGEGADQYGDTTVDSVANQHQFQGQSTQSNGQQLNSSSVAMTGSGNTIYFGFDKYSVDKDNQTVANKIAEKLLANPSTHIVIAGYTDPRGSQEYNFHLGQKRANAVQSYLAKKGVPTGQMCTVSYGELKPAASPSDYNGNWQKAYAMDRRVEVEFNQKCGSSS